MSPRLPPQLDVRPADKRKWLCEYPAGRHHVSRSRTARSVCMRPMGCLGAIALCLARLCLAQDSTATPAANISTHTVIVRARSLIGGTSERPLRDAEIVIRGNRIVDVYTAGTHPPPAGAQVIDLGAA